MELRLCDLLLFRGAKVAHITSYLDTATMLRQMGLLPNSPLHAANRRASLGLFVTQVDTSVEQRNKAVVHRFVEEVINQKNPAAAGSICAREMRWHGGAIGEARDLPRVQSLLASIFSSFPDLNLEILDMIAEEDRVAVRLTMRGTHLGAFQGIPATGRRVSSSGTNTYRVANDRIVEGWWQHDLLEVMQQLDAAQVSARPGP